jgi:3-oxoacyl-[acyl-carrier protein] reductase
MLWGEPDVRPFLRAGRRPRHAANGGGRIVNFADWLARSGRPGLHGLHLPYYVAKAGVIALTEALALELAPDQILVNAIAPGPILRRRT